MQDQPTVSSSVLPFVRNILVIISAHTEYVLLTIPPPPPPLPELGQLRVQMLLGQVAANCGYGTAAAACMCAR